MTAKNKEYAELWSRLEDKQANRRKSAACEQAIHIIDSQRERDFSERIADPDALLRMYGDRDTRVCPSPAVKLYDADRPVLPQPPEPPQAQRNDKLQDIAQSMMTAVLCAITTLAAVVVLLWA